MANIKIIYTHLFVGMQWQGILSLTRLCISMFVKIFFLGPELLNNCYSVFCNNTHVHVHAWSRVGCDNMSIHR